jgi:sucrose-6-phosphate hydrolase SacC (GH32 family)
VSIEIFGNDGRVYMSMRAVRDAHDKSLAIFARGGSAKLNALAVHELESAWK